MIIYLRCVALKNSNEGKMYKLTGIIGEFFIKRIAKKNVVSYDDGIKAQKTILNYLRKKAGDTQFGKDHNFKAIKDIEDYQEQVSIRDYSDFWSEYWEKAFPNLTNITWPNEIPYFAKTSGTTTGKNKYIPCTLEMVKSNNKAGMQVLVEHYRNKPKSKVLRGRYFMFAGSPDLEQLGNNIYAGELSGISAKETPKWAGRERYYPPYELAQIKDWNEKLDKISSDCLNKNIRAISGLPSWLQILFLRIFKNHPGYDSTLKSHFPDLELLVHGGMSFEPYFNFFTNITKKSDVDFREIYAASEGFFAISDRKYGEGLRLIPDNGIFYEFIRLEDFHNSNPKRYWLNNIENNIDYVLIVTTCAGLWSYVVGDIIKFTDYKNLRLLFSGRLSQTLSMFGEKVLNEEIESVVATSLEELNLTLKDYTIFSAFLENDPSKGIHTYIIETKESASGMEIELAKKIDCNLKAANSGYATRRKNDIGIIEPKVIIGRKGMFEDWMNSMGKTGGQNKVPRIVNQSQMNNLLAKNKNVS